MKKCASLFVIISFVISNVANAHDNVSVDSHHIATEGNSEHLAMIFQMEPVKPRAGEDVKFTFKPTPPDLEESHGALMHIIGVRKDLKEFFHTHADQQSDKQSLLAIHNFSQSGTYKVWAEAVREGEPHRFVYEIKVRPQYSWREKIVNFFNNLFKNGSGDYSDEFAMLSTNGNSSCPASFRQSIATMADGERLRGSCCSPMDRHRYDEQLAGLRNFKNQPNQNIAEIPDNPYDVDAQLAKKLMAYYDDLQLSPEEQKHYDYAMVNSHEKGPCCCKCWRWYVYGGLAKFLIKNHQFTGEQITTVWNLSDGCGGAGDHAH